MTATSSSSSTGFSGGLNQYTFCANNPVNYVDPWGLMAYALPYLIDAGIDILNPIQTSAANMEPARLKKEFGKKIVFWGGGCDTQHVLGKGTVEEVRAQVKERIKVFAPGGGYVFNQVHNIQANVPPDNIIAMFDAAYENSAY